MLIICYLQRTTCGPEYCSTTSPSLSHRPPSCTDSKDQLRRRQIGTFIVHGIQEWFAIILRPSGAWVEIGELVGNGAPGALVHDGPVGHSQRVRAFDAPGNGGCRGLPCAIPQ